MKAGEVIITLDRICTLNEALRNNKNYDTDLEYYLDRVDKQMSRRNSAPNSVEMINLIRAVLEDTYLDYRKF